MLKNKIKMVKIQMPKEFGMEFLVFNLYDLIAFIKVYDSSDSTFKYRITISNYNSVIETRWVESNTHLDDQLIIDSAIGTFCNET